MHLRIIGGRFKGRALKSPKGETTRPTAAILRKSVFDICQTYIDGASFLDLFAGTGAMGFEALSRGAGKATFVESDRYALQAIEENIRLLGVSTECQLIRADAMSALKRFASMKKQFDLIYIDPPYHMTELVKQILSFLDEHPLLKAGATLFVEEALSSDLKPEELAFSHLRWINSRHFGKSLLHQFRKQD